MFWRKEYRIVVCEPGKPAYESTIGKGKRNQKFLVGAEPDELGLMEYAYEELDGIVVVYSFNALLDNEMPCRALICQRDGIPENYKQGQSFDVLRGTIFFIRKTGKFSYASLSDRDVAAVYKYFKNPLKL